MRLTFSTDSATLDGNTLSGVVHVTGLRALVNGQYEEFAAEAFDEVLSSPVTDVRSFWNHDTTLLLGRQSAGTTRLSMEDGRLRYAIDLPDTSYAADLKVLVDRGDLDGMSFGLTPGKVQMSRAADGKPIRRHISLRELHEISPVSLPAFEGTSVELHSLDARESLRSQLVRARYRVRRGETNRE